MRKWKKKHKAKIKYVAFVNPDGIVFKRPVVFYEKNKKGELTARLNIKSKKYICNNLTHDSSEDLNFVMVGIDSIFTLMICKSNARSLVITVDRFCLKQKCLYKKHYKNLGKIELIDTNNAGILDNCNEIRGICDGGRQCNLT